MNRKCDVLSRANAYESVVGREDKLMAFLTMMTMTKHSSGTFPRAGAMEQR